MEEKSPEGVKIDFKGFRIPKLKPTKLAMIFGSLIIGIFIGAVIITLFNVGASISKDAAADSAATYLTGNFLAVQGMSAEATEVIDEGDYYAVDIDIMEGDDRIDSAIVYVSKDGKSLILGQAYDLTEESSPITGAATTTPTVPKSDKPKVELFIMSYCPYGLQMQKGFLPVMQLFGDKIDASVKWVHYIMHGEKEAIENTRQYCIQEEQNDKYWDYANCFVVDGDVDGCLDKAGIDKTKLTTCIDKTTADFKVNEDLASGEQYPRYKVTAEESEDYGVRGSPTLIINGEEVSVGRSPEEIKQAVCAAFNTQPPECEQTLSSETPSPSFGGGTSNPSSSSCG